MGNLYLYLFSWLNIARNSKVSKTKQFYEKTTVEDDYFVNIFVLKILLPPAVCYRVTDPEVPHYGEPPTSVWRRYSEFELLRSYLEVTYPAIVVPPLPEKRASVVLCFHCMLCVDH